MITFIRSKFLQCLRHLIVNLPVFGSLYNRVPLDFNMESPQPSIQYVPSNFNVHVFKDELLERKLVFQSITMNESLFLYVNDADQIKFDDLSLAMKNRYDTLPISTRLIGNFTEEYSKNMAGKISRKTNKAVFLSCNIDPDRRLIPLVEKRIFDEIRNFPDKF